MVSTWEAKGKDIPPEYVPPGLLPGAEQWLNDFFELGTDRSIAMGLGPLPASSIKNHTHGWDPDEAELFRRCMRAMDHAFLAIVNRASGDDPPDEGSADPVKNLRSQMKKGD